MAPTASSVEHSFLSNLILFPQPDILIACCYHLSVSIVNSTTVQYIENAAGSTMSNPVTQEDSNTSVQREWFDGEWFQPDSNLRWRWIKLGTDPRKIVLNPRFPDTLQKLQNRKSNSTSIRYEGLFKFRFLPLARLG